MTFRLVYAFLVAALITAQPNVKASGKIRWDRQSFAINNHRFILFGGSMHYFRVPESEWEPALRQIAADGFNLIDTYVPWSVHEPEEGRFDFDSLQRFLNLANKYGLYVVARPGPYICSEFDQGGFPRWLSGKRIGFRTNSEASRHWTKHWYEAVMPLLARNQVSRGGPVVMVQLENEYGHPQYLSLQDKREYLKFLFETASAYGFEIPLMGNDIQFAQQQDSDPVSSKIYGTVDAYFGSYKELEGMLTAQRNFNQSTPVGAAEYSLSEPEATLTTMLASGAAYLDLYMFRGGSQFGNAAKGYEASSYIVSAPIEEGGPVSANYYPMRTMAGFLRNFGELLARSKPAEDRPTSNDPELWLRQRNAEGAGFLFVRSDSSGVNERTLRLETVDRQRIQYRDPRTGSLRTIPQHSTLLLRPREARIYTLNLPLRQGVSLAYSTADLLGRYQYRDRNWLVLYGEAGAEGEVSLRFGAKPPNLNPDAIWDEQNNEAVVRVQFSQRDQVVTVADGISLLVLDRQRAYRAKEFQCSGKPALLITDADTVDPEVSGDRVTMALTIRHTLGPVTLLSDRTVASATSMGQKAEVESDEGVRRIRVAAGRSDLDLRPIAVQKTNAWTVGGGVPVSLSALRSMPESGVWRKGIVRFRANFPGRGQTIRLRFFTDDYHSVWLDGHFVAEASNRALDTWIVRSRFGASKASLLEIYIADTGRPKEDLRRWRMDEKKGLASADWTEGTSSTPVQTRWDASFVDLQDLGASTSGGGRLAVKEYSFPRPDSVGTRAVWRAHLSGDEALVYLNGVYVEHHQAGQVPSNTGDRPGIYLPPSMLSQVNKLVIVSLAEEQMEAPRITADLDTIRMRSDLILDFSPPNR